METENRLRAVLVPLGANVHPSRGGRLYAHSSLVLTEAIAVPSFQDLALDQKTLAHNDLRWSLLYRAWGKDNGCEGKNPQSM